MTIRAATAIIGAATLLITMTACSSTPADNGGTASTTSAAPTGPAIDLASVCPSTVTIQTNWNPEAEHGPIYQLLGANPKVDAAQKSVTGDLIANGRATGVQLQVRAGGPAVGYQSVSSTMYQDKSITLGFVPTDEAIQNSSKAPTTAVFAQLEHAPAVIMWDPKTYPNVKTVPQLGKALEKSGGVVRYSTGATYMSYLLGKGYLSKATTSGDYDGSPSAFVVAGGKDAQQGYATTEPYIYEHEVSAWGKPLRYQLVSELGYDPYESSISVRSGELAALSPCLKQLVPIMQQADVDYIEQPATTNALIVNLVQQYNNGWTYDAAVADFAAAQMKKLGLVSNGEDGVIGAMSDARVQSLIDNTKNIFTGTDAPKADLSPKDLITNQFLDTTIGLR